MEQDTSERKDQPHEVVHGCAAVSELAVRACLQVKPELRDRREGSGGDRGRDGESGADGVVVETVPCGVALVQQHAGAHAFQDGSCVEAAGVADDVLWQRCRACYQAAPWLGREQEGHMPVPELDGGRHGNAAGLEERVQGSVNGSPPSVRRARERGVSCQYRGQVTLVDRIEVHLGESPFMYQANGNWTCRRARPIDERTVEWCWLWFRLRLLAVDERVERSILADHGRDVVVEVLENAVVLCGELGVLPGGIGLHVDEVPH